ncbi:MAG: hypothetical protein WC166_06395 [Bacteroidales bacterium]
MSTITRITFDQSLDYRTVRFDAYYSIPYLFVDGNPHCIGGLSLYRYDVRATACEK